MKQTSSIEEPKALKENGWKFYEKCRCTGVLKYKYTNENKPGLVLEWWVKYSQFKITYKESMTKVSLTKISMLESILKGL